MPCFFRGFGFFLLAASPAIMAQTPNVGGCDVFPANNVWNTPVDKLPLDANSATYIQTIGPTDKLHPDYGAGGGIPYVLVPGTQPKVNVTFRYTSDPGPYPIPPGVPIEGGYSSTGDRHALIIDNTNCILYELFSLYPQADGSWEAGSGAIFPLNSNKLRPNGWTSADAAGLPIFPGLVRYDEVIAGKINHALRVTAPQTRDSWIWPARHEASSLSGAQYPPMGQRFRLKASFDISAYPVHVQTILQAMKTYGIILADNGTSWHIAGVGDTRWNDDEMHQMTSVTGSDFEAVDESSLIVDPNSAEAQTSSEPVNVPTGWVNVVSKNSGKCLDMTGGPSATGEQVPAQQWTCLGGTNQEFQFTAVTGGYEISIRNSGLALQVKGGASAVQNGTPVDQYTFGGTSNQIWKVVNAGNGYYSILPSNDGSCLDVRSISKNNGAAVQQWTCLGGENQIWSFVPAS